MRQLRFLITGTGRSGTVYMARLLTSLGVPCGHETIFDWQGIRGALKRLNGKEPLRLSHCSTTQYDGKVWKPIDPWLSNVQEIEAESSYMAAPFLQEDCLAETFKIHVVRSPLKVIESFCNQLKYFQSEEAQNSYEHFVYRNMPELKKKMTPSERTALYYILWNQLIESKQPQMFYRVESSPIEIMALLNANDFEPYSDTRTNSFVNSGLALQLRDIDSSIIRSDLIAMGKRYGYNLGLEYLMI